MKAYTKAIVSFILLLACALYSKAQEKTIKWVPTIGYTQPILDNGNGIHLGLNTTVNLSSVSNFSAGVNYHLEKEIGLEQKAESNLGLSIGA